MNAIRDVLTLKKLPTELFIQVVWIAYLLAEAINWGALFWYSSPTMWQQGPQAMVFVGARIAQQFALVVIAYFIMLIAKKLLVEDHKH